MESLRPRGVFEYLEILWRKKLLFFLAATPVLIATTLIIRRIPNIYESRSLIVISNAANEDLLPGTPLAALTQQLTSHGNLTAIARRYDLYRQASGQQLESDAVVARLRKEIKLDIKMRNYYPDAPESLTISYRYTDPTIVQHVVSDLVSLFEQANVTMRGQAAIELERFGSKIAEVENQLQELAPQRELALIRGGAAGALGAGPSSVLTQRISDATLIDSLSDKEFMLERQIDEQKRLIIEQEKVVKSAASANGLASSSAYGVLLGKRAEVEGEIKDLATSVTEKNPKMIQARTKLAEINREIARLEAASETNPTAATGPEARELRAMQRELLRLQTDLEVTQRDMSRKSKRLSALPDAGATGATGENISTQRLNEIKAEYDRLMGRYNWLRDKQDSMQKLSGRSGGNPAMFQVIDAPHAPQAPIAPNRNLLRLVGLGMALGLGLLAAVAREFPRLLLINNDRDVEYYLGTPVLALVPETLTSYERSRRRRLWLLRVLTMTLLAAVMTPVFVMALDRIQIFEILGSR